MTQAEQFLKLAHTNPANRSEEENKHIQAEFDAVADLAEDTITFLETGDEATGGRDMRLTFPDGSFLDMLATPGTKTSIRLSDGTLVEEHGWHY